MFQKIILGFELVDTVSIMCNLRTKWRWLGMPEMKGKGVVDDV